MGDRHRGLRAPGPGDGRGRLDGRRSRRSPTTPTEVTMVHRPFPRRRGPGRGAARRAGAAAGRVDLVGRAGLRVPARRNRRLSRTWARPGPLSRIEWERVRTVPYLTDVCWRASRDWPRSGRSRACRHERIDGSGYPRGLSGSAIPQPARILAAAEVYQALREESSRIERPDRGPRPGAVLLEEASSGPPRRRSGERRPRRRPDIRHRHRRAVVGGLSAREVEVLALPVRGLSNKQIAPAASISARTVGATSTHLHEDRGQRPRGGRDVRDAPRPRRCNADQRAVAVATPSAVDFHTERRQRPLTSTQRTGRGWTRYTSDMRRRIVSSTALLARAPAERAPSLRVLASSTLTSDSHTDMGSRSSISPWISTFVFASVQRVAVQPGTPGRDPAFDPIPQLPRRS